MLSHDLARELAEISHGLNRRVGLLIDRAGRIDAVAVGEAHRLEVPRKPSAPSGRLRFCTLRFVATKLVDEELTRNDLAPLALHRLDALALVAVEPDGGPGPVRVAHLLPASEPASGKTEPAREPAAVHVPRGLVRPKPRGLAGRRARNGAHDVSTDGERYRLLPPRPAARVDEDFLALIGALEEEFDRHLPRTKRAAEGGRAILVHVTTSSRAQAEASMSELEELAASANLRVVERVVQRRQRFDARTLLGAGRLQDLVVDALRLQAEFIVVDQNLSPAQARALAEAAELKVLDRTQLILDIFAARARTHEGRIQVELAQLNYLLPRLMSRGDSGLSRLEGGIGGRGPGEQKLEIDRRRVRTRIQALQKLLQGERTRRQQRRSRRRERDVPVVSIVGYTNAGKSTLLNVLTKSDVFVEDKMFATLDPSSRRLRLPREREVVINDTVGFIRDLPKDLIAAFRATLEEIEDSDLLVHLVDASHAQRGAQIAAVDKILADLGFEAIPRILALNKADLLPQDARTETACEHPGALFLSAARREGLAELLEAIDDALAARHAKPKGQPAPQAPRLPRSGVEV